MARTTIQIEDTTKDELERLKRVDGESFDSVVNMLIANYSEPNDDAPLDERRVREIANEQITERVVPEAQE